MADDERTVSAPIGSESRLRLTWRRTWEDRPHDFVCEAPEADMTGLVGRIYLYSLPGGAQDWAWFFQAQIGGRIGKMPNTGHCISKMEAARTIEAKWFELLAWAQALGLRNKTADNRPEWDEIDAHNRRAREAADARDRSA